MVKSKEFNHAAAAIVVDNRRLMAHVGRLWDYFVQGADFPAGEERLSVALGCERNGAHRLLEALNASVKSLGRRNLPRRAVEGWLALSSRRLLNELLELSMNLDAAYVAQADSLRHAVNRAMTREDAFTNFLLCESGGNVDMPDDKCHERLDKFIRDLKNCFNDIAMSVEDVEVAIERRRSQCAAAKRKRRRSAAKSALHPRGGSAAEIRRKDLAAIRKEVRRRAAARLARGQSTTISRELELLYRDEAWSRRCHQWTRSTLYTYIIR